MNPREQDSNKRESATDATADSHASDAQKQDAAAEGHGAREDYHKRIEKQLKEWGEQIESLKGKVAEAAKEVKNSLHQELESLKGKHASAVEKLKHLREAGSEGWSSVKTHLERLVDDLKHAVGKAAGAVGLGGHGPEAGHKTNGHADGHGSGMGAAANQTATGEAAAQAPQAAGKADEAKAGKAPPAAPAASEQKAAPKEARPKDSEPGSPQNEQPSQRSPGKGGHGSRR